MSVQSLQSVWCAVRVCEQARRLMAKPHIESATSSLQRVFMFEKQGHESVAPVRTDAPAPAFSSTLYQKMSTAKEGLPRVLRTDVVASC